MFFVFIDNYTMTIFEEIIDLVNGEILSLGHDPDHYGQAGQHDDPVQVERAGQLEGGVGGEKREQLEGYHDQEAAEGSRHSLKLIMP